MLTIYFLELLILLFYFCAYQLLLGIFLCDPKKLAVPMWPRLAKRLEHPDLENQDFKIPNKDT